MKYTQIRQEKKPGTKTVWVEVSREVEELTREEAQTLSNNLLSSIGFMKRLGGKEHKVMGYTSAGYILCELVSTSPDRENRTIRTIWD